MKIIKVHICGFCLKDYKSDGKKVLGVEGLNGFICIACIKLAKQRLEEVRTKDTLKGV